MYKPPMGPLRDLVFIADTTTLFSFASPHRLFLPSSHLILICLACFLSCILHSPPHSSHPYSSYINHVVEPSMGPLRDLVLMADTAALFAFGSICTIASRLLFIFPILSCTTQLPSPLILRQPRHNLSFPPHPAVRSSPVQPAPTSGIVGLARA